MWMVTKITTVNEADYSNSGTRAVTTEQPEGLSFPEWRRQHLDGWEQFHQAATEDEGRVYGFARKDPETTVWLWVKHQETPQGEAL